MVAYCPRLTGALTPGMRVRFDSPDPLAYTASGRVQVLQLNQEPATPAPPFYNAANNAAPTVAVPDAQPGELLIAAWVMAGNIVVNSASWDTIGPTANTPSHRTVWRIATGPETFSAAMASGNAWAFSGVRMIPAVLPAYPLKAWDGAQWRGVARAS
jgi:hypothetical protein